MALLNSVTAACLKNLQAGWTINQRIYVLRALHKSAASEALEISATGEETMSGRLIEPMPVDVKTEIKTLKDMPGPSTLSNLIEFFWRDGFSRIHEIQVKCPFKSSVLNC